MTVLLHLKASRSSKMIQMQDSERRAECSTASDIHALLDRGDIPADAPIRCASLSSSGALLSGTRI